MNSNRNLIDSMTAHVSLYHSQIPNPNSNHRSAVLRWFYFLSVHQRRSFPNNRRPQFHQNHPPNATEDHFQSAFQQGFTAQTVQCGATTSEDERTLSGEGELKDFTDVTNSQEKVEEHDKHFIAIENLIGKPYISCAVNRVARYLQVLWPRSRTNIFYSNATGLSLPSSDVDLVVCLLPVRNLEPIKEAGILEGRNGIKETSLQHAARYLANQEWVKSDSLKIAENTAIPNIMLVVEIPCDLTSSAISNVQMPREAHCAASEEGKPFQTDTTGFEISPSPKWFNMRNDIDYGAKSVRLDISFKSPTHTGLQTTGLVKDGGSVSCCNNSYFGAETILG